MRTLRPKKIETLPEATQLGNEGVGTEVLGGHPGQGTRGQGRANTPPQPSECHTRNSAQLPHRIVPWAAVWRGRVVPLSVL